MQEGNKRGVKQRNTDERASDRQSAVINSISWFTTLPAAKQLISKRYGAREHRMFWNWWWTQYFEKVLIQCKKWVVSKRFRHNLARLKEKNKHLSEIRTSLDVKQVVRRNGSDKIEETRGKATRMIGLSHFPMLSRRSDRRESVVKWEKVKGLFE